MTGAAGGWLAYWDTDPPLYVSPRHRDVHYRKVAQDVAGLVRRPDAVVLDFGCGEALHAPLVAAACRRLLLADGAPAVRRALATRLAGRPGIEVLDTAAVPALGPGTLDLVVVNSVVQYLTPRELDGWLLVFRAKLVPGGRLVVADVIPEEAGAWADVLDLLRTARAHGFVPAALAGLARTFFSDYRRLRRTVGLTRYAPAALRARLEAAGFTARRLERNLGFSTTRLAFEAVPRG